MKRITESLLYGHLLSRVTSLPVTLEALEAAIKADLALGFIGTTIVHAVLDPKITNDQIVALFVRLGAKALVCGFLDGNGPDPLRQPFQALASLEPAATLARMLYDAGCGPATLVGPMHTLHRKQRTWDAAMFRRLDVWFGKLNEFGKKHGLKIACEALNSTEDSTPSPFQTIKSAAAKYENIYLHCDLGHLHSHGLGAEFLEEALQCIAFFEITNVGRSPLSKDRGIDFMALFLIAERLPQDSVRGIEPFSKFVIKTFELGDICDTTTDGPATAEIDAHYLEEIGMMAA